MSLFLYKPHVEGPTGAVTTPDILIDRLLAGGAPVPVGRLSADPSQQVTQGETGAPGLVLVAAGAGTLLAPALALGDGRVVLGRAAWRLRALDPAALRLAGAALPEPVAAMLAAGGGEGDMLPRGVAVLSTAAPAPLGPVCEVVLEAGAAAIRLVVWAESLEQDSRAPRPLPRYSVGPTRTDVTHYV